MRAIWKGALTFGLIHVPVNLYSATEERELKFSLLHKKDLSEIRYAKICKQEEKEVPYSEIVKGYETDDGHFVVLTEEDFKNANIEKTKNIEILTFTDEDEVDSIYYDKIYYLEPGKNADKAYSLLLEALKKSKKVAVAKFVLRNHERLAIIKPHNKILVLNQLRLPSEIKKPDIEVKTEKASPKELEMAMKLVDQLTGPFEPEKFHDTYVEDLKAVIKQKAKGGKVRKKGKEPAPSKVHDIMSLLKASLEEEKPAKEKTKKRKAG